MEIRKSRSALFSFGGGKGASFPSRFIYLDLASMAQVRRARSLAPGLHVCLAMIFCSGSARMKDVAHTCTQQLEADTSARACHCAFPSFPSFPGHSLWRQQTCLMKRAIGLAWRAHN